MNLEDATVVIQTMAKYKDFFVDIMMTEELGLQVPEEGHKTESMKEGVVMFCSFASFGALPILRYVIIPGLFPNVGEDVLFCVRPEEITLWASSAMPPSSARNQLEGQVQSIITQGPLLHITLNCGFPLKVFITLASAREMNIEKGICLSAAFKASSVHLIPR